MGRAGAVLFEHLCLLPAIFFERNRHLSDLPFRLFGDQDFGGRFGRAEPTLDLLRVAQIVANNSLAKLEMCVGKVFTQDDNPLAFRHQPLKWRGMNAKCPAHEIGRRIVELIEVAEAEGAAMP